MSNDRRRPSSRLTFEDAIEIWIRIIRGEYQSRIAADYDVNIGRISEIKTAKKFEGSEPKAREKLVLGIRGTYAPRPAGRQLTLAL